jgi:hypothetical protein
MLFVYMHAYGASRECEANSKRCRKHDFVWACIILEDKAYKKLKPTHAVIREAYKRLIHEFGTNKILSNARAIHELIKGEAIKANLQENIGYETFILR